VAAQHKALLYHRLPHDLHQMKGCLASGFPFTFGFGIYESFQTPQVASSGSVPLPGSRENLVGGHAALAVGYDDARDCFIARNSYGAVWGEDGYFTIPYAYLTQPNLSGDFWVIRLVG
jgi:C1A family cysteine protease